MGWAVITIWPSGWSPDMLRASVLSELDPETLSGTPKVDCSLSSRFWGQHRAALAPAHGIPSYVAAASRAGEADSVTDPETPTLRTAESVQAAPTQLGRSGREENGGAGISTVLGSKLREQGPCPRPVPSS